METFFELDGLGIKKLSHLINNVFIVYSPRTVTIEPASSIKTDTNISYINQKRQRHLLPQNSEEKKFMKLTNKKADCWSKC